MNRRDIHRVLPVVIAAAVTVEVVVVVALGTTWALSLGVLLAMLIGAAVTDE